MQYETLDESDQSVPSVVPITCVHARTGAEVTGPFDSGPEERALWERVNKTEPLFNPLVADFYWVLWGSARDGH